MLQHNRFFFWWLGKWSAGYFAWLSATILLQQLLVGYSTYWLIGIELPDLLAGRAPDSLVWGIVPLVTAYLLSSVVLYLQKQLGLSSWRQYGGSLLSSVENASELSTPQIEQRAKACIGPEALSVFQEAADWWSDSLSVLLNLAFNTAAVVYCLGSWVALSLLAYLFFLSMLYFFGKPYLARLSQHTQQTKLSAIAARQLQWDEVLLGSPASRERSRLATESDFHAYRRQISRQIGFEELANVGPAIVLLIALLLLLPFAAQQKGAQWVVLLLASLPRLLQLLQYTSALGHYAAVYARLRAQLEALSHFLRALQPLPLSELVQKAQLRIYLKQRYPNRLSPVSTQTLLQKLQHSSEQGYGRYWIQGANGAGKTALLKWMKRQRPDAVYLGTATHTQLSELTGSSGECQRKRLEALFTAQNQLLLLDEWDNALDPHVRQAIDDRLWILSAHNCILEVLHDHRTGKPAIHQAPVLREP